MATLIAVYNSEGCVGRCDAKCYNAVCEDCQCICGGVNHGVGQKIATENTQEMAEAWIDAWEREHPNEQWDFVVPKYETITQTSFFSGMAYSQICKAG